MELSVFGGKGKHLQATDVCRLMTLTLTIATSRRMPFIVSEEWRKSG